MIIMIVKSLITPKSLHWSDLHHVGDVLDLPSASQSWIETSNRAHSLDKSVNKLEETQCLTVISISICRVIAKDTASGAASDIKLFHH